MKRFWIGFAVFAVALAGVPAIASAQQQDRPMVRYGITGGINLNNVQSEADTFDDVSDAMIGFQAGIQANFALADIFSVNPELVYSRRGWDTEGNVFGQQRNLNYNFSYLELPLLLQASAEVADGVRPKLFGGPHAALFLDGSTEGANDPFTAGGNDIDGEEVNDMQWGVTGGVGVNVDVGRLTMTSDVRYQRNLTGVFQNVPGNADSIEHENWQLTLGFLF